MSNAFKLSSLASGTALLVSTMGLSSQNRVPKDNRRANSMRMLESLARAANVDRSIIEHTPPFFPFPVRGPHIRLTNLWTSQ